MITIWYKKCGTIVLDFLATIKVNSIIVILVLYRMILKAEVCYIYNTSKNSQNLRQYVANFFSDLMIFQNIYIHLTRFDELICSQS